MKSLVLVLEASHFRNYFGIMFQLIFWDPHAVSCRILWDEGVSVCDLDIHS